MTMHETKRQLQAIIEDSENRVVALSGAWGTGKSHLWEQIRDESKHKKINDAVYASLFGVSDLGTLKVKLAEQVLANNDNLGQFSSAVTKLNKIRPLLQRLVPHVGLLEEVALLASPLILKDRFVVIDDIERKGDGLAIDHILGFIDEHVQRHEVRFLIIMNTDKLQDAPMWEVLREKVVDHEVQLATTPEEAFNIANTLCSSRYSFLVQDAIRVCGVVNIRIAKKVIRAVNLIFDGHDSMPKEILARMIPSTVLLAATHYKGIESGPSINFILNTPEYPVPGELVDDEAETGKREADWRSLIQSLGIGSPADYEFLVADFLRSGLFERARLDEILKTYELDESKARFNADLSQFHQDIIWDVTKSEQILLNEAESLCERIGLANAHSASSLYSAVSELAGGDELAEEIISKWINAAGDMLATSLDHYHFTENLHPRIKEEAQRVAKGNEDAMSIVEVCSSIRINSGWSLCHENALNLKLPEDYEEFLRSSSPEDRKTVFLQFRNMYVNRGNAYRSFGPAIDAFIAACREIAVEPKSRLQQLIITLMNDAGMPLRNSEETAAEVVGDSS